jgi:type II secretory pathway pseudopilin PulG
MTLSARMTTRESGTTLVELVIAITVISIAVTAVLGLLSAISIRSADAMTATQAASIASAYLDEALSKAYQDPYVPAVGRLNLSDVRDYNFVDNGARDANDNPIPGLGQYTIQISAGLDPLGAVPDAVRVDVSVTAPNGAATRLTGFRTRYAGQVLRQ